MKRMLLSPWLLAAVLYTGAAHAQTEPGPTRNDALYTQLGGQAGLVALMDDLVPRLMADPRMGPFFKDVNTGALKEQLVTQFCEVSGGPCKRVGPDMRTAHAGMDITRGDFNALVEVLQDSLTARGVPFATQNRLLAQLAPMHRDIVNVP